MDWRATVRSGICTVGALLLACTVASAEEWTNSYTGTTWNNPISSFLDTTIWSNSFRLASGAATSGQPNAAGPPPALIYKPGPSLVPDALAGQVGQTPEQQAELRRLFGQILTSYNQEATSGGYANDLGAAGAFFVLCNYAVLHPEADPSEAAQDAVREQVWDALGALPELAQATDKDKQSVAEMLIVLGAFPVALLQSAAQDADGTLRTTAEKMAAQSLESFLHADAALVEIGETGLSIAPRVVPLAPDAQGRVTVGKLTVAIPRGWKAEQHDDALVAQPEAAGDDFVLLLNRPGETVYVTANDETFDEVTGRDFSKVERQPGVAGQLKDGWVVAEQVGRLDNGVVVLAAALRGPADVCIRAMAVAASADVYHQYQDAAAGILRSVELSP